MLYVNGVLCDYVEMDLAKGEFAPGFNGYTYQSNVTIRPATIDEVGLSSFTVAPDIYIGTPPQGD